MHFIYLVRRGRKYHTDQSHRILLTRYFFTSGRGRHFDLSPLAVQRVATRLDRCVCRVCCVYVAHVTTGYSCTALHPSTAVRLLHRLSAAYLSIMMNTFDIA